MNHTSGSSTGYIGIQNEDSVCYLNSAIQQLFFLPAFRRIVLEMVLPGKDAGSYRFLSELQSIFLALEEGRERGREEVTDGSFDQQETALEGGLPATLSSSATAHIGTTATATLVPPLSVDPLPLCSAIWDPNGQGEDDGEEEGEGGHLNPSVQMDVSEFFSLFFAQLFSSLAPSPPSAHPPLSLPCCAVSLSPLLHAKDVICGEIRNELRAVRDGAAPLCVTSCEQFFFLSVSVGAVRVGTDSSTVIRDLHEALLDFSREERVDAMWPCEERAGGGKAEGMGGGLELLSSTTSTSLSAKSLPPHLLIHLKRFRFDFLKMRQVKVNARFEFPDHIDLWQYTSEGIQEQREEERKEREEMAWIERMKEGIDDGDIEGGEECDMGCDVSAKGSCKYTLSGVIVHTGTARDGHYFSLVKERQSGRGNRERGENDQSRGKEKGYEIEREKEREIEREEERESGREQCRWLKMNDEEVTVFPVADMQGVTFGGAEGLVKRQSAFVLVYDRD